MYIWKFDLLFLIVNRKDPHRAAALNCSKMDGLLYKFALKYTDIADGITGRGIYASFGCFSVLLNFFLKPKL